MTATNELADLVSQYVDDPLGYVLDMFPWGSRELSHHDGPDEWQARELREIGEECIARNFDGHTAVAPIRRAVASGHDIGKTTLMAWIANWVKDTRPDSQGTVTANTFTQLETKTWAAIAKWAKMAPTRDWWEIGATKIWHKGRRESWFLACQSSSEENSEAFAGQHAAESTSYYLFDEASAIPGEIWKVAEGGLADGQPMIFAFGNPTRNTGEFYEACFGARMHRWVHKSIDSRTTRISNKTTIEEWLQDYGEDSDFFRVRVRGLPPNASEAQLIPKDLIRRAMGRHVTALPDDPLIVGVDVPDGGSAWFIVRFRRGLDGHPCPPIRIPGSRIDRPAMIVTLAKLLREPVLMASGEYIPVAAMFIDSAFGSPICERLRTLGFDNAHEVNFGGKSPDIHFSNMRAYMWAKGVKEWLERGSLAKDDEKMLVDLSSPGFHLNKTNAIVLESKEDMRSDRANPRPSPDDGDALALTFAQPVAPISKDSHGGRPAPRHWMS